MVRLLRLFRKDDLKAGEARAPRKTKTPEHRKMLDMRAIRDRLEEVKENVRNRNIAVDIQALLEADELARKTRSGLEAIRQRRNEISNRMKSPLPPAERQPLVEEGRALKETETRLDEEYKQAEASRAELQTLVPNFTHPDSPLGKDDTENLELRAHGEIPSFDFKPKDHVQLMEALDLVDFEGGAKVTGQKFYYLKNEAVMLELSLLTYAANRWWKKGAR